MKTIEIEFTRKVTFKRIVEVEDDFAERMLKLMVLTEIALPDGHQNLILIQN